MPVPDTHLNLTLNLFSLLGRKECMGVSLRECALHASARLLEVLQGIMFYKDAMFFLCKHSSKSPAHLVEQNPKNITPIVLCHILLIFGRLRFIVQI